jgi:hypothetical protein
MIDGMDGCNLFLSTWFPFVLLNGVPSKEISYRRGVRQADLFSPILFVAVADLVQTMVNRLMKQGVLTLLFPSLI